MGNAMAPLQAQSPLRTTRLARVVVLSLLMLAIGLLTGRSSDALSVPTDPAVAEKNDFAQNVASAPLPVSALSVVSAASASPATYAGYPHIGLYGTSSSSGWPLVGLPGSSTAGPSDPVNSELMDAYAKFQRLILPAMPAADLRPDILTGLRSRNPNISIFAYTMGHTTWCPGDSNGNIGYPVGTYYRDYYLAVTGGDPSCASTTNRFLWMQDGKKPDDPAHAFGLNVNLAHRVQNPDTSYTYDVAEDLAAVLYEYGRVGRNWNGIFIDVYCESLLWMETSGHEFDYARAGYGNDNADPANRIAFDLGWRAGFFRLTERLRQLATADGQLEYPLLGNCGNAGTVVHQNMNGWMRENFPYQQGGNWYWNMLTWQWGYLHQDANFRSPQINYINTAPEADGPYPGDPNSNYNPYSQQNLRKMRFGLGSATLGNGMGIFNIQDARPQFGDWGHWWFDEYGVNTTGPQAAAGYGQAMNGRQYTGWLGQPLTPAYQYLATNYAGGADLFDTNLSFETAGGSPDTAAGWTTVTDAGSNATVTRDTTEAADGSASMKAVVGTAVASPFGKVTLSNTTLFPVTNGLEYSITFKAKASANLPLHATFHFGPAANLTLRVDTEWRQYQAVVRPTATDPDVLFRFEFGLAAGTYWIDDVHVRAGASSVWRRDFERGTVLVNPTLGPITVDLGTPMKKISGSVNPTLNDGTLVNSITLAGTNSGGGIGDALFLLSVDVTPPGSVNDLSAG